jgi:hypothetical protein
MATSVAAYPRASNRTNNGRVPEITQFRSTRLAGISPIENPAAQQCRDVPGGMAAHSKRAAVRETIHSPPMRVPFSATERFISRTTGTSASVTTANIKKTSK